MITSVITPPHKRRPIYGYLSRRALERRANGVQAKTRPRTEHVAVFPVGKMEVLLESHERKSNLHRNLRRVLANVGQSHGLLPMAPLPGDILAKIDELESRFPNFSEVIKFYHEQFALAALLNFPVFAANPLLIAGPPGIGKTAFCQALAKIIQTPFEVVGMSSATAGFVLGGMSSNWADGKPGKIVDVLSTGRLANPMIVVDEIDKAATDSRYDPLGALYQLLERETAREFVDEGLEVPIDASRIVWVATANDLTLINDPILSRFAVIHAKRPTPVHMEAVLASIYHNICSEHSWGERFTPELRPDVVQRIIDSGMEPRIIKRELVSACGRAAIRYRNENRATEDNFVIQAGDFVAKPVQRREVKIGFV